jgi:hypothetical protein
MSDPKLNPTIIKDRLLEIFNKNKKSGDNFTAEIGGIYSSKIIIKNNGRTCYEMWRPKRENDKYVLFGGIITKCSNNKSGSQNLLNLIEFGLFYKYDYFYLDNTASLEFEVDDERNFHVSIDLTKIKLLDIGNTWYSQFGFGINKEPPFSDVSLQDMISPLIFNSFDNLIDSCDKVYDTFSIEVEGFDPIEMKTDYRKEYEKFKRNLDDLSQRDEAYKSFEILESDIISNYIKRIISTIYKICPNSKCGEKAPILKIIIQFIDFLISILFSIIAKKDYVLLMDDPNYISKLERLDKIIFDKHDGYGYGDLILDFSNLTVSSKGGKKYKKTRKMKNKTNKMKKYKKKSERKIIKQKNTRRH